MILQVSQYGSQALLLLVSLAVLSACHTAAEDEAAIGRAVAAHVDPLNGFPTAVLDEYLCQWVEAPCTEGRVRGNASTVAATPLVSAFADARRIPVVGREGAPPPRCSWSAEASTEPAALYAQFWAPPQIKGDSARVLLTSFCFDEGPFEQVHEFILRRTDGQWVVERRSLESIT